MAFVYKIQKAENRYLSFDLLATNFGFISSDNNTISTFSSGLAVTFEKRNDLGEKVQFIRGWSPGINVSLLLPQDNETLTLVSPSLGYRLGFLYQASEKFYISLQGQVVSRLNLHFNGDSENLPTTFNIGFSQEDVSINLVYRFKKKE